MNRVTRTDIRQMLEKVDEHLAQPVRVIIIGGGAIALRYLDGFGTRDIESTGFPEEFIAAWKAAQLPVSLLDQAGVWDAPYEFESRCVVALKGKMLEALVPERHDLAMMKIVRCDDRDLQALEAMHKQEPFSGPQFLELYLNEMNHIVTDLRSFRLKFLVAYERLFGPAEMKKIESNTVVLR